MENEVFYQATAEEIAFMDAVLAPPVIDSNKPFCQVSLRDDGACFVGMNTQEIYARRMQHLISSKLFNAVCDVGWYDVLVSKIDRHTLRKQVQEVAKAIVDQALLGERALLIPTSAVEFFLAYLAMEESRCEWVTLSKRYGEPFEGLDAHLKQWDEHQALLQQLGNNLLRKVTQEDI